MRTAACFLLLLAYSSLLAQISGTVVGNDGSSTYALEGATIAIEGQATGAIVGPRGQFTLDIAPGETVTLVVSYVGHAPQTIRATSPQVIQVQLETEALGEVEVVESQSAVTLDAKSAGLTSTITRKELSKAPCCNLSESFETSAAVDVAMTDAVTGSKRIEMLGLSGKYVQLQRENFPLFRGFQAIDGFSHFPGPWAESIQLTRGIGSVVNGHESMTGQINLNFYPPDDDLKHLVNVYLNEGTRMEANYLGSFALGEHWSTRVMAHGSALPGSMDRNTDGFLDMPQGYQAQLAQTFVKKHTTGWDGQVAYQVLTDRKSSGQNAQITTSDTLLWDARRNLDQFMLMGKTGTLLANPRKSVGLIGQLQGMNSTNRFGYRFFNHQQMSGYFNGIYQYLSPSTLHTFKTGVSLQVDQIATEHRVDLVEDVAQGQFTNWVPGVFGEWQYDPTERFTLVLGARVDLSNQTTQLAMVCPRLHLRYVPFKDVVWRASAGRGWRNEVLPFSTTQAFASGRDWGQEPQYYLAGAYGVEETAWNMGTSITHNFKLNYRPGMWTVDFFYTRFGNQYILDLETPGEVNISAQSGTEALSFLAQVDYSPVRRWDVRLAYKWLQADAIYGGVMQAAPFLPEHRFLINTGYETRSRWRVDVTAHFFGPQRIPFHPAQEGILNGKSPWYTVVNLQINKHLGERWELFAGAENLLNYQQPAPILNADQPWSQNFDGGLTWAPIFGRNLYAGVNLRF